MCIHYSSERWTGPTGRRGLRLDQQLPRLCRGLQEGLPARPGGDEWRWVLLLVGGGAAHVGIGVGLGSRTTGSGRGLQAHAHYARWLELRGLVFDGVRMTRRRVSGGRSGRLNEPLAGSPPTTGKSPGKGKSAKRHDSDGDSGKAKKAKESRGGGGNGGGFVPEEGEGGGAATATGGGGRWVHVD